ncbi:MAG: glycosyltransferase [Chitinophagales bacterium]|nr:glycosyltransferase [Chitinophagales bacterium]
MFFSLIVPLYNRSDEIRELLESLTEQTFKDFEVIVVEDGSKIPAEEIVMGFADRLDVKYYFKPNSGQGFARNYGFERANGQYFVIFDSDIIVPPYYLEAVYRDVTTKQLDAFGGPDAAHSSFTDTQKAISYAMTSYFTTGGIRGKKKNLGPYHPRSFNMGLSRKVYETVGGFIIPYMGEDIEFSIRIIRAGFKTALIPDAYVFHKRRTDLKQFYKQLHFFGRARINIYTFFKDELKLVHFFPAAFTIYLIVLALSLLVAPLVFFVLYAFLLLFITLIFIDASWQYRSVKIGLLSVGASLVQLTAYGIGFMGEFYKRIILKRPNDGRK